MMEFKLKIFYSNWITFCGIFLTVYLTAIVSEILSANGIQEIDKALAIGIFGGLYSMIVFGSIFWLGIGIALFIFDFLLFNPTVSSIKTILIIEWMIISSPFIYWAFRYDYWQFIFGVAAFFITQLYREKLIRKEIVKFS